MSKKLAAFLCLLVTLVEGSALTNEVYAATPACSNIPLQTEISYSLKGTLYPLSDPNASIPEGVETIFFTLRGPLSENVTYRLDFENDSAVTNENPASSETVNFSTHVAGSTNPRLIRKGSHNGTLKQKNSTGGYDPYCTGVNYRVGVSFDYKDCRISLNPSAPAINQIVVANISTSPLSDPGEKYEIFYSPGNIVQNNSDKKVEVDKNGNGSFAFTASNTPQSGRVSLYYRDPLGNAQLNKQFCEIKFDIKATTQPVTTRECIISPDSPTFLTPVYVTATNLEKGVQYRADLTDKSTNVNTNLPTKSPAQNNGTVTFQLNATRTLQEGKYSTQVYKVNDDSLQCNKDFTVGPPGSGGTGAPAVDICKDPTKCTSSGKDTSCDDGKGIKTAIGCIHTSPVGFIKDFLKFIIGISGGLAFLLMLLGAFQMVTSAGNPETLQAGRDRFQSAIIGLLFVIFAVLLLQIIGVDILDLGKQFGGS